MARIRVCVLGPVRLEVGAAAVRLTPLTARLLVRLVAADGEPVPVRRLRRDVWGIAVEPPHQAQRARNEVQKRVLELRRALDPEQTGEGLRVLRTEQQPTATGPATAYRLVLGPDQLDSAEFAELVNGALHAAPASAVRRLESALALVRGKPLADVAGEPFAEASIRRLTALYETARRDLIRRHTELGRGDLALPVAQRMAEERPDDPAAAEVLVSLQSALRARHGDELLRQRLPGLHNEVVVVRGDLFEQQDANLVVGFADTFDTATGGEDFVISPQSVQGQLVERLFGGNPRALDDKLRSGLRGVRPLGTESAQAKPRGRRTRYPIGTVVPLAVDGRRVFATAYSRLGNDLVARSGPADLRLSLDALWPYVTRYGLFKPVAIPLVGSGLARILELRREQLMIMIVDSFARACRQDPAVAPELRIVIRPADLERTELPVLEKHLLSPAG